MAINEPFGWSAECDECGKEYDGELYLCESEDEVIEALESEDWVYDEDDNKWLCPECAEAKEESEEN